MIALFPKLKVENLLKSGGSLLDLGCGNGKKIEPFVQDGYEVTFVDGDPKVLGQAQEFYSASTGDRLTFSLSQLEEYAIEGEWDGVVAINSLPFIHDKATVRRVVQNAYQHISIGGFLYFTVFGPDDGWVEARADRMSFFTVEEALSLLSTEPYYVSEDRGYGAKMSGGIKKWHIVHLLYVKK